MSSSPRPSISTNGSFSPTDQRDRAPQNTAWNPISLRLYKVLGANYEDSGTKEALETLSSFYAESSTTVAPKTVNGHDNDDMDSDSEGDVIVQERRIPSVLNVTAARARKSLRRDTEARLAEGSHKFLKAFAEVDEVCRNVN